MRDLISWISWILLYELKTVVAHEHHDSIEFWIPGHNFVNEDPVDWLLKSHAILQILCWAVLFPIGAVLGITKNRWHVPLQAVTCLLSLGANRLGHHHVGRQFHSTGHSHFASYLKYYMITQALLGLFLKLHIMEGSWVRKNAVSIHGVIGKTFPIFGGLQMILGVIASVGFCFGEHYGDCTARILSSGIYLSYAVVVLLFIQGATGLLDQFDLSQDSFESILAFVWGAAAFNAKPPFPGLEQKSSVTIIVVIICMVFGLVGFYISHLKERSFTGGLLLITVGLCNIILSSIFGLKPYSTTTQVLFGMALIIAGTTRVHDLLLVRKRNASDYQHVMTLPEVYSHRVKSYCITVAACSLFASLEEWASWAEKSSLGTFVFVLIILALSTAIFAVQLGLMWLYNKTKDKQPTRVEPRKSEASFNLGRFFKRFNQMLNTGESVDRGAERRNYESVPLEQNHPNSNLGVLRDNERNRSLFDLGDNSDDGTDDYWKSRT